MVVLLHALLTAGPQVAAAGEPAETPEQSEASEHFTKGAELARQGDYEAALVAFESAYRLSPHASVLYNIAQAQVGLGRPVEAARALERYLSESGAELDPGRRQRASELLTRLRRRIGFIALHVKPDGASIAIDGREVAASPVTAPIPVAQGVHALVIRAVGRSTRHESIVVEGNRTRELAVELEPVPEPQPLGQLNVECSVPGVEILVNGKLLGHTPRRHPELVPRGTHRVEFARPGYRSLPREVAVGERSLARVRCALTLDPSASKPDWGSLTLNVNVPGALVRVDEAPYRGERLPPGPHHVRISKPGFHDWERTVRFQAARSLSLVASLEPTVERLDAARDAGRRRAWSIATGAAGLALLGSGVGTYIWNGNRAESWERRRGAMNAELAAGATPDALRRDAALWQEARRIDRAGALATGLGIGGVVLLGISGWLWWTQAGELGVY